MNGKYIALHCFKEGYNELTKEVLISYNKVCDFTQ
jgi:hypothetical protein